MRYLNISLILSLSLTFYAQIGFCQTYNINDINSLGLFLSSTGGGSTSNPAGWNAALPPSRQWKLTNSYDQWYGVTWNNGIIERRVKSIQLNLGLGTSATNGVGLTGSLPNNFVGGGRMDSLEIIDIAYNSINSGPSLPWISTVNSLKVLNISYNRFGIVGNTNLFVNLLTTCSQLEEFIAVSYLSGTAISANLALPILPNTTSGPALFANLHTIDWSGNGLSGRLTALDTISSALKNINVSNNSLEAISTSAVNNTVETINLSNNKLSNPIYLRNILTSFRALKVLQANNAMNTVLPTANYMFWSPFTVAAGAQNLLNVDLSNNRLAGTVAMDEPGYDSIAYFSINNNLIFEFVPPTQNKVNLRSLDLGRNNISGTLSSAVFQYLPNIEILNLGNNNLTGKLPDPASFGQSFYNLANITNLDLSVNTLKGSLRLDWLLDAQIIASGPSNRRFKNLYLNDNVFEDVIIPNAVTQFDSLQNITVHGNFFDFGELYEMVKVFTLEKVGNSYLPLNRPSLDPSHFSYSPQGPLSIGGVRRRPAGSDVVFRPESSTPVRSNQDSIYNAYLWNRRDTMAGANTIEFLGSVRNNSPRLVGTNVTILQGTASTSAGTVNLLPSLNARDFGNIALNNIDATHHGWTYYARVLNDSFPFLQLDMLPIRLVLGVCYDTTGRLIRCQEIMVRYNPDSLATASDPELFKRLVRASSGAKKSADCLCGDMELWEMNDTTNMTEVEWFGSGTRSTAGTTGTKPELLSADPNYDVDSDTFPVPSTPPNFSQGSTHKKPTLVAIIDSGTDYDHPLLKNRMWVNSADTSNNGMDDDNDCVADNGWGFNFLDKNNIPYDDHGHGTAIAGIIGGYSTNNISRNTGNFDSLAIIPMKFTDRKGNGTLFHAACAIYHAATYIDPVANSTDSNSIRVINASWGYYGEPSKGLESALQYAGQNCGILFVTSAGNDAVNNDTSLHYPSNYNLDNILVVAATTPGGNTLESYSNHGAATVHLAARGADATTLGGGTTSSELNVTGTSFATAQVSRAAGLLFHKYPQASYYSVKNALLAGVDPLQSADSLKLISKGKVNLSKAMAVMQNTLNLSECSNNIVVSTASYQYGSSLSANVFPNPFQNILQIELNSSETEQVNLVLVSVDGREIYRQTVQVPQYLLYSLNVEELPKGVYFLQIQTEKGRIVKKIAKFN